MKSSLRLLLVFAFGFLLLTLCVIVALLIDRIPASERDVAIMISGAAIVLCALVAWRTIKLIVDPIHQVTSIGRRIADGHLGVALDTVIGGDAGELQLVFKGIAERMFKVVSEVRNGTGSIANAAGQIAREHDALSSRTKTQSESLQTTAASMEELTSTVSHNAENAGEANRLARSASDFAEQGGKIMALVVGNMNSIKTSSGRIADIIGVIDAIAFQTNILALNAAVEAARAGEQGRGFSVVAAEVRNLAQRSAEAAREVKLLIDDSVQKVSAGNTLVEQAGRSMETIVASITQVNNLMGEIAVSSAQQRVGIEQVNDAVSQIEGFTQKNSSLVEGAIEAANRLQEKAVWLTSAVASFDLGAREFGSREEAIALVGAVVAELAQAGVPHTLTRINDGDPCFRDRDLYIVAIDSRNNTMVASGATPQLVGLDILGLKDSDGKYFAKEAVMLANRQGSGWVDYKFEHPVTRQILQKSTYIEMAGDLIVQCGVYKNQGAVMVPFG